MKKNKKGWWRIVESVIGVLIILSALIFFVSQQTKNIGKEDKAKEILKIILEEMEKNYTIREYILNENKELLNEYILNKINSFTSIYNFSFCITNTTLTCKDFYPHNIKEIKKNIFSSSILISKEENENIISKKLILYVWEK